MFGSYRTPKATAKFYLLKIKPIFRYLHCDVIFLTNQARSFITAVQQLTQLEYEKMLKYL